MRCIIISNSFASKMEDLRKVPENERPAMPDNVRGHIYKITCQTNGKIYVGQTRSHIFNHGKYRPFGYIKRWKQHISEAKGNSRKQSSALNDCIKECGEENFLVELLEECSIADSHDREKHYINEYNSFETDMGLNLTPGGRAGGVGNKQKERIANTLKDYFSNSDNLKKHSESHSSGYDTIRINKFKEYNEIKSISVTKRSHEFIMYVNTETGKVRTEFALNNKGTSTEDCIKERITKIIDAIKQDNTTITRNY